MTLPQLHPMPLIGRDVPAYRSKDDNLEVDHNVCQFTYNNSLMLVDIP